jgi:hypothetical protein
MAFKNDPISTFLDSVKAILTFSILFWSMSILFNSFRGPDPDRIGPDPDPDPPPEVTFDDVVVFQLCV